jgi:NAD(P)-dependent dehydrogenase (short-subunit alcohol dehydrogenase family)
MRVLVFGASGALGQAVCARFEAANWEVLRAGRGSEGIAVEGHDGTLAELDPVQSVVWAQGANVNDSVSDVDDTAFAELMEANVGVCLKTLRALVTANRIASGGRLVLLSSIWQSLAREGKLSYSVSKAAVGGLVRAAAADLAVHGIVVNAVLPGVVDTPMTRANLTAEQTSAVRLSTGFGRLVAPEEVAETVYFLGAVNSAITGQSIVVDLGFSVIRAL